MTKTKDCYFRLFVIETQNLGKAQAMGALPAVVPLLYKHRKYVSNNQQ